MIQRDVSYVGGPIFDGRRLLDGHAARFLNGVLAEIFPLASRAAQAKTIDLNGDILSPGYVDLQVNGGDGILLNDDPSPEAIARIAAAHRSLGATSILPTLITDTAAKTRAAIEAAILATQSGLSGVAGLHLEGPHLSVARKGAHDGALIRPMTDADLAQLIDAAARLPVLMVTIAPENVTRAQVQALATAGVIVSLGHSDADYATCVDYAEAGARCVTHLFNAMSQLGNREPGLVGAAIACDDLFAGLIADGIHVHPASIGAAWRAKSAHEQIFLVSDSMAVAGTDTREFLLNGRRIQRQDGRLTLADGTLAGADLDLTTAVRTLSQVPGIDLGSALAAATTVPARLIRAEQDLVAVTKAQESNFIRIAPDLSRAQPLCEVSV